MRLSERRAESGWTRKVVECPSQSEGWAVDEGWVHVEEDGQQR